MQKAFEFETFLGEYPDDPHLSNSYAPISERINAIIAGGWTIDQVLNITDGKRILVLAHKRDIKE
ncbi:MAG TPA: hypothetical protein DC017_10845 [Candidatus Wallbacteria bacterium]|jgi:hypothetical protein|nr:hypothetical protein [Candidatus Wallbacteria bacterium]